MYSIQRSGDRRTAALEEIKNRGLHLDELVMLLVLKQCLHLPSRTISTSGL